MLASSPPSTVRLRPDYSISKLSIVLSISLSYFIVAITISQDTECLVLQADAYHMLYNSLYLGTSIFMARMCRKGTDIRNTFGWIRIEVCGAVLSICFLSALYFSVAADALQTSIKALLNNDVPKPPNTDETQILPKNSRVSYWIGSTGVLSFMVNVLTFIIIGGYTHHQKEVLGCNKPAVAEGCPEKPVSKSSPTIQRIKGMFRDFFGCFFVMGYATLDYFYTDRNPTWIGWVDPSITILEVIILAYLSSSYAREAGFILLLTIPAHIDVVTLANDLYDKFPEIYDVHEFHIWQLTPTRIIATGHVVCQSSSDSGEIHQKIFMFLKTKGISHVTLQPEFFDVYYQANIAPSSESFARGQCFIPCGKSEGDCQEKKCCLSQSQSLFSLLSPTRYHQLTEARGQLLFKSQSLPNLLSNHDLATTHNTSERDLKNATPMIPPNPKANAESGLKSARS